MSNAENRPLNAQTAHRSKNTEESTARLPVIMMAPDGVTGPAVMTAADSGETGVGTATVVADGLRVRYRVPSTDAEDLRATSPAQKNTKPSAQTRPTRRPSRRCDHSHQ